VRSAKRPAPQSPQVYTGKLLAKRPKFDEQCLALNIWAPPADGRLRPVLFFIHGGAFIMGGGDPYDGENLAAAGDIVVVTINYRLGVLGFVNFAEALGIPDLPSNLGLRDQIAALHWVKDNITAFGGDPKRVTICGESAGSMSVSLLMLCREAWPLFHGAIMQSGAVSMIHSREASVQCAKLYTERLNLKQGSLEDLRAIPVEDLLKAQIEVQKAMTQTIPAAPWFDSALLPESLAAAHHAQTAPVPLIAGFNREEIRTFEILPGPAILPTKRGDLDHVLRAQVPAAEAERIISAYPRTQQGDRALGTDLTFGMPTRNFAERHARENPTWAYRFDYASPFLGAAHGLELFFLWPYLPVSSAMALGPNIGKRRALSKRMKAHWTHFVREGAPLKDWPRFDSETRATMVFDRNDAVLNDPNAEQRSAWAGIDVYARAPTA
jgi:para-nitrobenzyl esterase